MGKDAGYLEPVYDDLGQRFPSQGEDSEQKCSLGKEPGRKLFPQGRMLGKSVAMSGVFISCCSHKIPNKSNF